MAADRCTDRERLEVLCSPIAGVDLDARRSELFWRYVRGQADASLEPEVRRHLEACQDCRQALEQERALLDLKSTQKKTVLAVCPSSQELIQYLERDPGMSPWQRLEIKRHAERCEMCGEEVAWAAGWVSEAPAAEATAAPSLPWFSWRWALAAAAAVLFVVVYPTQFGSRRYARYAQLPDIPYDVMRAEYAQAHPDELGRFRAATDLISVGEYRQGAEILQALHRKCSEDPGVNFFLGCTAARQGRWSEALEFCTRAEQDPLGGFRCWYLANLALLAGKPELARREIQHAKGHEPYAGPAARLEKMVD